MILKYQSQLPSGSWNDRKVIMPDLKAIYRAETAKTALDRLGGIEAKRALPADRSGLAAGLGAGGPLFNPAIRKMICRMESLHRSLRKIIESRGPFPPTRLLPRCFISPSR
jgi:putative transposase